MFLMKSLDLTRNDSIFFIFLNNLALKKLSLEENILFNNKTNKSCPLLHFILIC